MEKAVKKSARYVTKCKQRLSLEMWTYLRLLKMMSLQLHLDLMNGSIIRCLKVILMMILVTLIGMCET